MSPERDTVRTTITISHPRAVAWVREQEAQGVKLQEAMTEAILKMLDQRDEIQFLRSVVQAHAGVRPTEPQDRQDARVAGIPIVEEMTPPEEPPPEGWKSDAFGEYG